MGDFGGLDIIAAYSVENHNAVQVVLADMKLMQRATLSGYCNAPLKLVPVDGSSNQWLTTLSWTLIVALKCIFGPSLVPFDICRCITLLLECAL